MSHIPIAGQNFGTDKLLIIIIYLTASGLSPGGSGYYAYT
jgi:hypothetical protein